MRPPPLLAIACWLLLAGGASAQQNVSLIAFGAALRGANASALSTWTGRVCSTATTSTWQGVWCEGGNVTRVRLASLLLNGTISCDVAAVTSLIVLDLGDNQLTGSIPPCLFNLTSLVALDVGRNWLTGPLPALPATYPTGSPAAGQPNKLFFSVMDNQVWAACRLPSPDAANGRALADTFPASCCRSYWAPFPRPTRACARLQWR
jgi:hypothetical protein